MITLKLTLKQAKELREYLSGSCESEVLAAILYKLDAEIAAKEIIFKDRP